MKVPILMKRTNKVKMVEERYAKILVKAKYATYGETEQTYKTRELRAEDLNNSSMAPKRRGRPPKVIEVIEEEVTQED